MPMSLSEVHAHALGAFDDLETMARAGGGSTTDFHEQQFVFEIGTRLRRSLPWVAFEFSYPDEDDPDRYNDNRCDILGWRKETEERYLWLETKWTGFSRSGRWRNGFGALGWAADFEKLRGVPERAWKAGRHRRVFSWAYQFENYRPEVRSAFGDADCAAWRTLSVDAVIGVFGTPPGERYTLSRVVRAISDDATETLVSIKPAVMENADLSALILTATP